MDQWDEIVWRKWPFMVIKTVRLLDVGYNVYRADEFGMTWFKLNAHGTWFKSEQAAILYADTGKYTDFVRVAIL